MTRPLIVVKGCWHMDKFCFCDAQVSTTFHFPTRTWFCSHNLQEIVSIWKLQVYQFQASMGFLDLQDEIKSRFGTSHPFTKLVPDLSGMRGRRTESWWSCQAVHHAHVMDRDSWNYKCNRKQHPRKWVASLAIFNCLDCSYVSFICFLSGMVREKCGRCLFALIRLYLNS